LAERFGWKGLAGKAWLERFGWKGLAGKAWLERLGWKGLAGKAWLWKGLSGKAWQERFGWKGLAGKAWLERLAMDILALRKFVNYGQETFYNIGPRCKQFSRYGPSFVWTKYEFQFQGNYET
jgi:hypothetical protein